MVPKARAAIAANSATPFHGHARAPLPNGSHSNQFLTPPGRVDPNAVCGVAEDLAWLPEATMATPSVMSSQANPVMPKSHVGFDSITNQIERKLLKRGFQFNVICVGVFVSFPCVLNQTNRLIGQTGLGKSTLINTIFASHLIDSKGRLNPAEAVRSTTEIQAVSHGQSLIVWR